MLNLNKRNNNTHTYFSDHFAGESFTFDHRVTIDFTNLCDAKDERIVSLYIDLSITLNILSYLTQLSGGKIHLSRRRAVHISKFERV